MAKTVTPRLTQTRWSSPTDTVRRLDFDTDAANLDSLVAIYGQGLFSARPAAGTAGRFYAVAGEADAKLNGRVYYDNGNAWSAPRYMTDGIAESTAVGNTALTAKGVNAQTGDIFRVNTSTDVTLFKVTSSGVASTQTTVGVSAGAYLGNAGSHDAAGSFVSVAPNKPVLAVRGHASQTESLIVARDGSGSPVFTVSNSGSAMFGGSLTANGLTINGTATFSNVTGTGTAAFKSLLASPTDINNSAASYSSINGHLNNIVNYLDGSGGRIARVTSDGTFATNTRILVGNSNGNSISQTYPATTGALTVNNSYPSAPAVRVAAHASQTGKLIEFYGSDNNLKANIDNNGNTVVAGNISGTSGSIGVPAPTQFFNSYIPKFEVVTGTETGAYNQGIVVRHANSDATTVSRSLGLYFKMSDESNGTESNKWAGISAVSSNANALNPSLVFYTGGTEAARLDSVKNLTVNGDINISTPNAFRSNGGPRAHWFLSADETNTIGLQTSGTYYRSSNHYWYDGGIHNDANGNAGGGRVAMSLTSGGDPRLNVSRVTINDISTFNSTTPSLSVGAMNTTHMQFSNASINSLGASQEGLSLNLQQAGGTLNLGGSSTETVVPSRMMTWGSGGNRFFVGANVFPGTPQPNDWWFDSTNNRIQVRGTSAWITVASA